MKKFFTLTMLLVLALTVNAQGYRKWDFTQWSAQTIDNLMADAAESSLNGWSDIEKKADAGEGKVAPEATAGKCFWYQSAEAGELKANGVTIEELVGLDFGSSYANNRSLAIAIDYPSTTLGEYAGPQYLWLGGGGKNLVCFTIPKVRIGQKITFTVESHKPSDARGVELYVGSIAANNKIGESFKPTTLATYTWEDWELPAGATDDDGDGLVDVLVYNTSGCHIYNIEIGTADQKTKVGYLYGGELDNDPAYAMLNGNDSYVLEPVAANAALALESLEQYDAVVLSSTVESAEAIASLKAIRPFVPMLNLNPAVYEAWGAGTLAESTSSFIKIGNKAHALFKNMELVEEEGIVGLDLESNYQGVTLADVFATDLVLATDLENEQLTAIHGHNLGHNGYLYLPSANNAALLANALQVVLNSKAKVTPAPKPTIKLDYKNQNTNVVISSSVPSPQIFYTTDGTTPTTESTAYTEPFNISTTGVTVKAVALGDGYLLSDVAELAVDLRDQAPRPTIAATMNGSITTVRLACDNQDVDIFYNYTGSNDSTKSTKYTEPITLLTPKTITAFTANSVLVASELAQQDITIEKPVQFGETLSHMDANKAEYYEAFYNLPAEEKPNSDSNSKVAYFFSWGKSKTLYSYYNTTAEPISTTIDPETGDEKNVYPKNPEEKFDFQNGWAVRSRGQVICEEVTIKPGKDVGVGSTYNPATVDEAELQEQYPVTDFYLNISEWNTENAPRTGMIYSTQKFKGPFAIVSYISNGNANLGPMCVFETGTDIEGDAEETKWNQVGDTCFLNKGQRLYQKFVRFYDGTDEVYLRTRIANGGSKAGYYDIYVISVDPASLTGISEVAQKSANVRKAIFSLSGVRQAQLQRGLNIVVDENGATRKMLVK